MSGILYLCSTPIGNMEDITIRTINKLKEVDLIAAEDTRNSIKVLNHYEIKTPMTSYHEYNKYDKADYLVNQMLSGINVAIITDAGTPGISDPGEELVKKCYEAGIRVEALPGPCACVTALTVSGLATRRFCFEAFLPTDKKERAVVIKEMKKETRTIVMYEAPHRLVKTLNELYGELGDRRISVCRELTKRYETIHRHTFSTAIEYFKENEPRGEIVIAIEGLDYKVLEEEEHTRWNDMPLLEHMDIYLSQGRDKKEAMKLVAVDRGVGKRDIYSQLLELEKGEA